jgi:endonuclease YncB( thermonuclease family)
MLEDEPAEVDATPAEDEGATEETETPEATEESEAEEEATPTAEATIPVQDATIDIGETPLQVVPVGDFRYNIETAIRDGGAGIPELGLPAGTGGEWVALVVTATNWSEQPATLSMPDFVLDLDNGTGETLLDTGTGAIAQRVPGAETYTNTTETPFATGESRRFLLLYLVPAGTADIDLSIGGQQVDLNPALSSAVPVSTITDAPAAADLLEATVIEVLDASTIEVEVDGARQLVSYLGIDAPAGDSCFAAEATELNKGLVEGQTVWLERQRSNIDRDGRLLRDVWVRDDTGAMVLVSERLVGEGAAESATTTPNTRLRGWLDAAQAVAEQAGAGIWSEQCAAERAAGEEETSPSGEFTGAVFGLVGLAWAGTQGKRSRS